MPTTIDDWIRREAIACDDSAATLDNAVDRIIASLDGSVELLGFGEALHGGEEILLLRNRLFQRLVTQHGYVAIAMESSFTHGRIVNDYLAGCGSISYDDVQDRGFSHGFGRVAANRELLEWMRQYNAEPGHATQLRFYGFDIPAGEYAFAAPRHVLDFALDYLAQIDGASGAVQRERIEPLLGQDADWESTAVYADPTKAVGLTPDALALRMATEDLLTEFRTRRPELVAQSGREAYLEAVQYVLATRELLHCHAALARKAGYGETLAIRDALMADNLAYLVDRERERGKVFAFAHNSHLQRGQCVLPWAQWWGAGSQIHDRIGRRYAVIGSAVGVSEANGIAAPEADTLEARLTTAPGPARFLPTHQGREFSASEVAALPTRTASKKNGSYTTLTPQSFTDFDWLAVFDSVTYPRGAKPLPT